MGQPAYPDPGEDLTYGIVRDWHDRAHWPTRWMFCDHELCWRVREGVRVRP